MTPGGRPDGTVTPTSGLDWFPQDSFRKGKKTFIIRLLQSFTPSLDWRNKILLLSESYTDVVSQTRILSSCSQCWIRHSQWQLSRTLPQSNFKSCKKNNQSHQHLNKMSFVWTLGSLERQWESISLLRFYYLCVFQLMTWQWHHWKIYYRQ